MRKLYQARIALAALGIEFSVGPNRHQDAAGFQACTLSIRIDREITSRGAGRHATPSEFTLADVENMEKDGLSSRQIAENVNMSMANYYRRRKKAIALKESGRSSEDILF